MLPVKTARLGKKFSNLDPSIIDKWAGVLAVILDELSMEGNLLFAQI
jgi:hypothetical protein